MTEYRPVVEDIINDIIDRIAIPRDEMKSTLADNKDESNEDLEKIIRKNSSESERCRICYETSQTIPIIYPCECKGTICAVHLVCLERWLEERDSNNCELCGHKFAVIRVPRYSMPKSVWIWLCSTEEEYRSQVRCLRIDIIRCLIVTPVTVFCSYICMVVADSYSLGYRDGYILLFILIMLSYFVWIYLTTQYHYRIWFNWWKKKNIVKILLPEDEEVTKKITT